MRFVFNFNLVIDCGFVKVPWFEAETQTNSLVIVPVSKASANQRAGRAGRVRTGKAYRYVTKRKLIKNSSYSKSQLTFTVGCTQRKHILSYSMQPHQKCSAPI